jgi:uncharacterized protein YjbJ (UPF0337 family)
MGFLSRLERLASLLSQVIPRRHWQKPLRGFLFSGSQKRSATTHSMEIVMDWNRVEGNWKQVKGMVKEKWGKLTDDDLTTINGKRDQLEGKIQERYGIAKDQVRKDVDDWYSTQSW